MSDITQKIVGLGNRMGLTKEALVTVAIVYPLLFVAMKTGYTLFLLLMSEEKDYKELFQVIQHLPEQLFPFLWLCLAYLVLLIFALKIKQRWISIVLSYLMFVCSLWVLYFVQIQHFRLIHSSFDGMSHIKFDILSFFAFSPLYVGFCCALVFLYQEVYKLGGSFFLLLVGILSGLTVPVAGWIGGLLLSSLASLFHVL